MSLRGSRLHTKKKSLVPLFGVAFIVAIVSTSIFYGLFVGKLNSAPATAAGTSKILVTAKAVPSGTVLKAEHLKDVPWMLPSLPAGSVSRSEDAIGQTVVGGLAENEILTHSKLASKSGGAVEGGGMGIPDGMRAVSLQVQDSAGVVALLKIGHRVDVQVVASIGGQSNNEPQLKTVLENMQVLALPREQQFQRPGAFIVTVLATPKEAAMLGLADSAAKIRLALRNPIDHKKENLGALGLKTVFGDGAAAPLQASRPPRPPQPQQVQLLVRVAGAGAAAVKEMETQLEGAASGENLQVAALRMHSSIETTLTRMQLLSTSRVSAGPKREAGAQWSLEDPQKSCGLRIQFLPAVQSNGRVLVRVHPEVTTPGEAGVSRRQVDTEVEVVDGQSFLIRGLTAPEKIAMLWQRLFPGRPPGDSPQELLVFVTPRVVRAPFSNPPTD